MAKFKSQQGFTLIELIMVMVVMSILAAMTTSMITSPVNSYLRLESRTRLVDNAETALRRMQRDLRQALPNSVRVTGGGAVIEMLHTLDGGRYRAKQDPTLAANAGLCATDPAGDILDFTGTDTCFEVMGSLTSFNPQLTASQYLVVYNLGDAYAGTNRTTVSNSGNAKLVKFAAFKFPFSSPQQRFFIVDTPVTYRCDITTGQLLRYSGYSITSVQANPPTGVTGKLQVNNVASCNFTYTSSAATRAGLVSIAITLTDANGESARLMQQIHVDNAP